MDQSRRKFLKQVSIASLWTAYELANPSLAKALTQVSLPTSPIYTGKERILIYKIHNWLHGVQVCATKYTETRVARQVQKPGRTVSFGGRNICSRKFDPTTFEPIEIVDVNLAQARKKFWWESLNCQGRYVPYDLKTMAEAGQLGSQIIKDKAISTKSEYGRILKRYDPAYRQDIQNLWNKVHPETWPRAIEYLKTYWIKPRSEKQIENARRVGQKYGGHPERLTKNLTPEQITAQRKRAGYISSTKRLMTGTHNLCGDTNPQNRKFLCPDGKITAYSQAVRWCKQRGLNFTDARELTKEEYARMYEPKVQTRVYQRSDGTNHGRTKLTDEEIIAIKYEYPFLTTRELANIFNVGSTTVSKIRRGLTHADY
jgi:hypothetical protein